MLIWANPFSPQRPIYVNSDAAKIAWHSRRSLFANTLVLPGFKLPDEKQFDAAKLDLVDATLAREGGHFENAIFEGADLRKIDLANAQLQGADLLRANLQSAQLQHANLDGSNLFQAKLQLASFDTAKADGANLAEAELQGAWLQNGHCQTNFWGRLWLW
jgi:uncharacterized protein YjbI with pentapeptide repeats